jgi:hypothetical protein
LTCRVLSLACTPALDKGPDRVTRARRRRRISTRSVVSALLSSDRAESGKGRTHLRSSIASPRRSQPSRGSPYGGDKHFLRHHAAAR